MLTELLHRALCTRSASSLSRASAGHVSAHIALRLDGPHVETLSSAALAAAHAVMVSHPDVHQQSSRRSVELVVVLLMNGRQRVVQSFILGIISHPGASLIVVDGEVRLEQVHVHLALAVAPTRSREQAAV